MVLQGYWVAPPGSGGWSDRAELKDSDGRQGWSDGVLKDSDGRQSVCSDGVP